MDSTNSHPDAEQLIDIANELLSAIAESVDCFDDEHNHILNERLLKHLEEHPDLVDGKTKSLLEKSIELEANYLDAKASDEKSAKSPTARVSSGGSGEMNEEDMWECDHADRVIAELQKLKQELDKAAAQFSTMSTALAASAGVITAASAQILILPSHGLGAAANGLTQASTAASSLSSGCTAMSGIVSNLIEDWEQYKKDQNQHAADVVAVEPVPELPKPISGWDIDDPYDWVAGDVVPEIEPFVPPIVVGMTSPSPIILGPNVTSTVKNYIKNEEYDVPKMEFLDGGSIFWEPEVSEAAKAELVNKFKKFLNVPDIKLKYKVDKILEKLKDSADVVMDLPNEMIKEFMGMASGLMKEMPSIDAVKNIIMEYLKAQATGAG